MLSKYISSFLYILNKCFIKFFFICNKNTPYYIKSKIIYINNIYIKSKIIYINNIYIKYKNIFNNIKYNLYNITLSRPM